MHGKDQIKEKENETHYLVPDCAVLGMVPFPLLGVSETETLLTEKCLAQFGEKTCDAARLLASRNMAVVSDGRYYEYDPSGNQKGAVDLTHPQLKNASVSGIEIPESASYAIVPCFDYVTEQSYCAFISKTGEIHFSDLMAAG